MTEYKRLTKRLLYSNAPITEFASDNEVLERLAELEDKIENGTLIELPCKVGDTVYYETIINGQSKGIMPHKVICVVLEVLTDIDGVGCASVPIRDFGKTVFLTKAEAEQCLKELKDER